VEFYLSAARCTVEAAVLPRTSKAAVEQMERFFSFPPTPGAQQARHLDRQPDDEGPPGNLRRRG